MRATKVEPVLFRAGEGNLVTVEWSPPAVGILSGLISGAVGVEPEAFDFRGEKQPAIGIDGKLQPAVLTILCDGTWVLSIPTVVVTPRSRVSFRFLSHRAQQDGVEFLFAEDVSAAEWLVAARKHQHEVFGVARG